MKYRQLGRTGLEVSEIGFGTWGIGGAAEGMPAYGPTEDRVSRLALQKAFDLGVNFYDTSDLYGYGNSERLLGDVFKDVRDQVVIATKAGLLDADGGCDFSTGHLRASLEGSLSRLGTDYVDLFMLHSPPIGLLRDDPSVLCLLQSLQNEGKVREIGISVRSPDDGLAAVADYGFKAIQVNFNMLDQRSLDNGLLDECEKGRAGVIVRTPLCFGFLTGAYAPGMEFGPGDHRRRWSPGQKDRWAGAHQLFSAAVKDQSDQTSAQLALRFCLSYSAVSTVIPGMLTSAEVEENLQASNLGSLPEAELIEVRRIYQNNEFFYRAEEKPSQ